MFKRLITIDAVLALTITIAVCLIKPPEKVHGLAVDTVTYDSVNLSWDEAAGSTGYHIYRSSDGENFEYLDTTNKTNYSDTGLDTGITYVYKIRPHNGIKKAPGDDIKATPVLDTPKIDGTVDKGQAELSINRVDGALGYKIYRDKQEIDTIQAAQDKTAEDITYVDENADADTDYEYTVTAIRKKAESDSSNQVGLTLISPGTISIEPDGTSLNLAWDSDYTSYKLYKNDELLTETSEKNYSIKAEEGTYKFKLIGTKDDVVSPETVQEFKVEEVPMDNKGAINAAVNWAVDIANDDSFTYGTGNRAHRYGCYFCGNNLKIKGSSLVNGHSYKKTYCCNPFISAAYAHGAGDPALLKACQSGGGISMSKKSFKKYGNWKDVGKPSYSNLQKGDVLVKPTHVAMYIGDGKYVQAGPEGWNAKSIAVSNLSNSRYNSFKFVMRYTGTGSGTMYKVEEVTGQ